MKNNAKLKKRYFIILLLIISFMAMQSISAQSGSFMSKSFVKNLIVGVKELMKSNEPVEVLIDEMIPATSNKKTINSKSVVFEVYIEIKTALANFFADGKYLSGLYIDNSGIYDIANGSFFDVTHYLKEEPKDRFLIEGTYKGKFYIILTLSNEIPYFGDFLNESFNKDESLANRYIKHALKEIQKTNANVFFFELDSTNL